jgi:hypothetical protein
MTPRQQRRLLKRYENQLRLERNGAPIPPEIAAKMTKAEEATLYQCMVQTRDNRIVAVGPKGARDFCEQFLFAILGNIASGKERDWFNPHVCAVL